ncbi:MAG: methyltransferase [Thermodesulfobacteriota bacterium]|nr:MAG: methyltransferase [Thermodesulfobacteriota bacterium]
MPDIKDRPGPSTSFTVEALGPFKFYQSADGHRLTTDSVLLASFILESGGARFDRVADLGAASGAISLQIAAREPSARITAFEIDPALAALAQRNIAENGLEGRVDVMEGDLRTTCGEYPAGTFSLAVSNPPYVKKGAGRVSPVRARAVARTEESCPLAALVAAAAHLIGKRGRAAFVYPARRLDEMLEELGRAGLRAIRLRFVYTGEGKEAKLFMVEAATGGELKVEAPVFL